MLIVYIGFFYDKTDEILIPLREKVHRCKDFKNVYRYMNYKKYLCDRKYRQAQYQQMFGVRHFFFNLLNSMMCFALLYNI